MKQLETSEDIENAFEIKSIYLHKSTKVSGPEIFKNNTGFIDMRLPFSHQNDIFLDKGMHLLFELPEQFKMKSEGKGEMAFAPNIWKINIKSEKRDEDWIVISDYILEEDILGTPFIHERKLIQIGKKIKYEELENLDGVYNKIGLTSIGWGTLSFDNYYPNCKDVFGFHDLNIIEKETIEYSIKGWYLKESTFNKVSSLVNNNNDCLVSGTLTVKMEDEIKQQYKSPSFNLSIGNSLEEAFTSLCLQNDQFNVKKIIEEEQFEAALNYSDIYDQKLDIISRLRHYQHDKQFLRKTSFTKWVINQSERQFENVDLNISQRKLDVLEVNLDEKLNKLAQIQYDYLKNKINDNIGNLIQEIKALEAEINKQRNEIIEKVNYITSKNIDSDVDKINHVDQISDVEFNISKNPCCLIEIDKENENSLGEVHKVEWEAEFIPHDTDNIDEIYELNEQYTDLIIKNNSDKIYNQFGERKKFYGNSYLTDTVRLLVDTIDKNIEEEYFKNLSDKIKSNFNKYKNKGTEQNEDRDKKLYEFHLEDFNQIVNGYKHTIAPFVSIFKDKELNSSAQIIEKYKDKLYVFTENEYVNANKLRNSAFRINRLRFINQFGIQREISPKYIYTPPKQSVEYLPKWIEMSPRILNPLGLKLDFKKYESEFEDGTPVLGWIIPVYINQHIEFFDADGYHIGFLDENSEWRHSPFDLDNSKELTNLNKDLIKIIDWFKSSCEKNSDFKENFIKEVQYTFEHIKPESYQDPSLIETIATTPIAITRTSIELLTIGQFNIETQKIPLLLGDLNQYNDGLIGYWHINDDEIKKETFFINNERFEKIDTNIITYIQTIYDSISKNKENALKILKDEVVNKDNFLKLLVRIDKKSDIEENIKQFKDYIAKLNSIQDIRINKIKSFLKYEIIENIARFEKEFRYDKEDKKGIKDILDVLKDKYLGNGKIGVLNKHHLYKQYFKKAEYFIKQLKEIDVIIPSTLHNNFPLQFKLNDVDSELALENNSSLELYTLLAPKSKLFVKTGLIPEKSISIPYNSIKNALNRIELTLLTAPIITPKEQMEISLLTDERYKWSWVNLENNEDKSSKQIKRITQDLALNMSKLNENEIKGMERYLQKDTFFPDQPEIRYFNMEKWEELSLDEAALKILNDKKKAILKIDPFNTKNASIPQLVLKEGWLSIKSTNN